MTIWPIIIIVIIIIDLTLVMSFHLAPHLPRLVVMGRTTLSDTNSHCSYLYIEI